MSSEANLPESSSHRRVILVLDDVSYDRLEMEDSSALVARSDVAIINSDALTFGSDALTSSLADRNLLGPGSILVQSPFHNDDYAPIEQAADIFAMDKVTRLSTLVAILGAKHVRLNSVEDEKSQTRWDLDVDAGAKTAKASARVDKTQAASFARKIKFEDSFVGSDPDIQAAHDHLRQWKLEGDRELLSLIEARSVPNNSLTKRLFSLDVSSESEIRLNAAAEVAAMQFVKSKIKFQTNRSARAHYRVEYTISF